MSNDYPRRVRDVLAFQNRRTITIVLENTGAPSEASGGNPVFDIGVDDYNADTKDISHTYAIATIQEGHNNYQPSDVPQPTTLTDGNGLPVAISNDYPDNSYLGRNTVGSGGRSMFITLSDSDLLDVNVIKGKAGQTNDSYKRYDSLLEEVNSDNGNQNNSQLTLSVQRATAAKNSNNITDNYIIEGIKENESNVGKNTIQTIKGKYSRIPSNVDLNNNINNPAPNGYTLKPKDFKNIGSQLPLLASGELYVPNDVNDPEEFSKAQAGAYIPGIARSGAQKVSVKAMQPARALNRVTNGNFERDTDISPLDDKDNLSFGTYNNWIVPFDGKEEFILPMLGIQIFALGAVCQVAAEAIKLNLPGVARDTYMYNFYVGFLTYFNIANGNIDRNVVNSVVFNKILADSVAKAAVSSLGLQGLGIAGFDSPWSDNTGWYVTNLRTLFRKISTDIMQIAGIGNQINNLAEGNSGDTVSVIYDTKKLLLDNNLVKIVNTFAARGSTSAKYSNLSGNGLGIARNAGIYYNSNYDSSDPNTFAPAVVPSANHLIKQIKLNREYRLGAGNKTQAIANASIRSRMILPRALNTATVYAAGDEGQLTNLTGDVMSGYIQSLENRLSIDDAKEFERYLNSSYMPFYFHDMRTNEIIAFHAFLNNMSDSFSADWQNTQAYGRVEPVFQYSSTTRELQVDFYVLATNELDHARMWAKINKLITLIYPQYTKGRPLQTTDGKKFIQPFSQIPGASPLFRIRVGDVWKSNYNRFNAMRLFGLGQPEFDLAQSVINQRIREERERIAREITDRIARGELRAGDEIIIGTNTDNIQVYLGGFDVGDLFRTVFGQSATLNNGSMWFGWGDSVRRGLAGLLPNLTILPSGDYRYHVELSDIDTAAQNSGLVSTVLRILNPPTALLNRIPTSLVSSEAEVQALINETGGALRILDTAGAEGRQGIILGDGPITMRIPLQPLIDAAMSAMESESGNFTTAIRENALLRNAVGGIQVTGDVNNASNMFLNQVVSVNTYLPRRPDPDWLSREVDRQLAASGLLAELENERNNNRQQQRLVKEFFDTTGDNFNPIMKSFEENGAGGGLAVVCKSMTFDWNESRWETNYTAANNNSRAPMWLKIQMSMTAIHDITPGIGADGYMTAPVYPVGPIATVTDQLEDRSRSTVETEKAAVVAQPDTSLLREKTRSGASTPTR